MIKLIHTKREDASCSFCLSREPATVDIGSTDVQQRTVHVFVCGKCMDELQRSLERYDEFGQFHTPF